jgi:WD40 repeat protein
LDETSAAIIDATNGGELHHLGGHTGLVSAVAWGAGGKVPASGTNDGTIKVWDAATGKETSALEARGEVLDLSFGPEGR